MPFSPRAWPQGQCAWASRQSAPPEPMLADVACGSDFCFAAAIRAQPSIVARVALLRVASLSSQFDSPACRLLTWAAKVAFVEYCSIAISVKRILYGPGNLSGPFCLPGRQLRLLKDVSKPVAQPCGRFFAIMGRFSGEKWTSMDRFVPCPDMTCAWHKQNGLDMHRSSIPVRTRTEWIR